MSKIGKYELQEKIGAGGFATVYKGRDPHIKRLVAVKVCASDDAKIRDRFFREAEVAGRLHHPNITLVYEFGLEGEKPYLVQEFLDGEDLDILMSRGTAMSRLAKLQIVTQIAEGLSYAHQQGVIHRDIKPSNIRRLESGQVKILDFGIAKLANAAEQLTRTGTTLGTAGYLAPEQLRGGEITPATDLFALGVLSYELFSGRRPFEGETVSELYMQILERDPESLGQIWKQCPAALERIVARCLAKDPKERYASAAELLQELHALHQVLGAEADAGSREASAMTGVFPAEGSASEVAANQAVGSTTSAATRAYGAAMPARTLDSRFRWIVPATILLAGTVVGLLWLSPWSAEDSAPSPARKSAVEIGPRPEAAESGDADVTLPAPAGTPTEPAVENEQAEDVSAEPSSEAADAGPSVPPRDSPVIQQEEAEIAAAEPPIQEPPIQEIPDEEPRIEQPPIQEPLSETLPTPVKPVADAPEESPGNEADEEGEPEPATSSPDSEAAVRRSIEAYRVAYANRDVAALRRVWPTLPERSLETAFRDLAAIELRIWDCRVEALASEASADCAMAQRIRPRVGASQQQRGRVHFRLERRQGEWVIVGRSYSLP